MINYGSDILDYLGKLPDLFGKVGALEAEIDEIRKNSIRTKPHYEVKEVASLLGVHRNTVYNKIKEGDIPADNVFGRHKIPHKYLVQKGLV